jgi:hypothetical protein
MYHFVLLGSISHPKLCPPLTKRLSVLSVLPLFVLEVGMVHIVHPVEIVTDIAVRKMKVHQENIGHNSLVWVGVLLESNCVSGRWVREVFTYILLRQRSTLSAVSIFT